MLAAIHDAEIGEQEYCHQHGPQGAVQMSGQRSHETGSQTQQKAVDARGHSEEQHPQRAGIEVEGGGLGLASHIRPQHLGGHEEGHSQEDKKRDIPRKIKALGRAKASGSPGNSKRSILPSEMPTQNRAAWTTAIVSEMRSPDDSGTGAASAQRCISSMKLIPKAMAITMKDTMDIFGRVMGYGLWVMGYRLWVMGCGLWVMGCGLWVIGYGLWVVGYGL